MTIDEGLLEVRQHNEPGYLPMVDFEGWRVAVLNFAENLRMENITSMQRHNETDEVFVLLKGRAILFVGQGDEQVTRIHAQPLEPYKIYNVKRAVWHHHTLSEDAMVLVVENRDTTYDNSPFCDLSRAQQEKIRELTNNLWR
jgi:ureidoglycolate hydrolase